MRTPVNPANPDAGENCCAADGVGDDAGFVGGGRRSAVGSAVIGDLPELRRSIIAREVPVLMDAVDAAVALDIPEGRREPDSETCRPLPAAPVL